MYKADEEEIHNRNGEKENFWEAEETKNVQNNHPESKFQEGEGKGSVDILVDR